MEKLTSWWGNRKFSGESIFFRKLSLEEKEIVDRYARDIVSVGGLSAFSDKKIKELGESLMVTILQRAEIIREKLEGELEKEERKRYLGTLIDSPAIYSELSDKDKDFVNNWAKKIIDLGGMEFVAKHGRHWRAFISASDAKSKKASGVHLRKMEEAIKNTGRLVD